MKLHVIVHECEEGGYWAQVPGIPGCATQGATLDDLRRNLCEVVEGCLAVEVGPPREPGKGRVMEIDV